MIPKIFFEPLKPNERQFLYNITPVMSWLVRVRGTVNNGVLNIESSKVCTLTSLPEGKHNKEMKTLKLFKKNLSSFVATI